MTRIVNRLNKRRALAAPVSLLLILFALSMISTVAYSYSLTQIEHKKQDLKLAAAEEKNIEMAQEVGYIAWAPGSVRTISFLNYGGKLRVEPTENHLQLNSTLGDSKVTLFNSPTGRTVYELPSTVVGHLGRWLAGDERAIVNQTASTQTQASVGAGDEHQEMYVRYRPQLTSSTGDLTGGRRVNVIRVYIININSSTAMQTSGELHIKAECTAVTTSIQSYDLNATVSRVSLSSDLDGVTDIVEIPLTIGASGSTVRIETVVSSVKISGVTI